MPTMYTVLRGRIAALLTAFALLLTFSQPASATHAENVALTLSDYSAGAEGVTTDVSFTTGGGNGTAAVGGSVIFTLPAGTDLSDAVVASFTRDGMAQTAGADYGSASISGNTITFANFASSIGEQVDFALRLTNVTNTGAGAAPVWSDDNLGAPQEGEAYSDTIAVNSPTSNQTYGVRVEHPGGGTHTNGGSSFTMQGASQPTLAVTSGALPSGLSFSTEVVGSDTVGTISGTATVPNESYSFDVTAQNAAGSSTRTFSGTVSPNLEISISASRDYFFEIGEHVELLYSVTNPGPDPVTTVSVSTTPMMVVDCPAGPLAVGATIECSSVYIVTESDLDTGSATVDATVIADGAQRGGTRFTLLSGVEVVTEVFDGIVPSFVARRQSMISSMIAFPGLGHRNFSGLRVNSISGSGSNGQLAYSGSLVPSPRNEAAAAADGLAMAADDEAEPDFNAWINGTFAWFGAGDGRRGSFTMASLGADYLVHDELLIGLAAHLDWMHDSSNGDEVTGSGFLAGPYVSAEVVEGVFLDAGLFYGLSANSAEAEAAGETFKGDFSTRRLIMDVTLRGEWAYEETTVRPSASLHYSRESADGYSVSSASGATVDIGGFESSVLQFSLGATVEHEIQLQEGLSLVPLVGFGVGATSDGNGIGLDEAFGELSGGLKFESEQDWSVDTNVVTRVHSSGLRSVSARARLGVSF